VGADAGTDADRFGSMPFYAALGRAFVGMCFFIIPLLFAVELIDDRTHHRLDTLGGIQPHHLDGLDGILFAPFLHASFDHLYSNAVPLVVTGTFVLAVGLGRFLGITALIAVASGVGVWFTGNSNTIVVGASGVIFGYIGYLLLRGIVERSLWGIAVGLLVGLLYGAQIVLLLPSDPTISWQAHLFGFLGGLVAAIVFRRPRPGRPEIPAAAATVPVPEPE
jgi:membrane associated rhomboid family serine protease